MSNPLNTFLFVFKMVMSLVYVGLGITFIIKPGSVGTIIAPQYAQIIGFLLIVYGAFRGYRAFTVERKP